MAGKFSKTTTPGGGYTDAVTPSRGTTDSSGRGVPDERRTFSKQREGNFPGNADPTHTPPGLSAEGAGGSEDAGTESDEAPSGRVQGG